MRHTFCNVPGRHGVLRLPRSQAGKRLRPSGGGRKRPFSMQLCIVPGSEDESTHHDSRELVDAHRRRGFPYALIQVIVEG